MTETVIVIGGAGGVGLEACQAFVASGYDVIATVLNQAERDTLLKAVPNIAKIELIDLGNGETAREQLRAICDELQSPLRAAVCCAGYAKAAPMELAPLADLRQILEVNLVSNVALYQATIGKLRESKGNLVLISSLAGRYVTPLFGYYSASKHALEAAVDAMRREASRWGVGIVAVQPGWIKTGMASGYLESLSVQISALNSTQRELYEPFLEDMRRTGEGSNEIGLPPSAVADVIVEAARAIEPRARYVIGDDAVEVIRRSREWSDTQIDDDFYQLIPSLAAPAG